MALLKAGLSLVHIKSTRFLGIDFTAMFDF